MFRSTRAASEHYDPSPTARLLVGLAITFAAVAAFSWYAVHQIDGVRQLQTFTVDRNRKDSLQLLRIQNNLHSMSLSMRDMLERGQPYSLQAWKGEFDRIRFDLEDALRIENALAPASRTPEQRQHLSSSLAQFWAAVDGMFALAGAGREGEARRLIDKLLITQQAAITAAVARLLILNNEAQEQAVQAIQGIYNRVERNFYYFLLAVLVIISVTSLYLIQVNRRIFERMTALLDQRRVLARKLISVQEEILRSVSRELHDEFGQILTAVGAMLGRAARDGIPPESTLRTELTEVREIAQSTLDKMRSLSQVLHPTILDDYGLERALEWYAQQFGKQTGIDLRYEKTGSGPPVPDSAAIHVYRILQEALTNVVRHSRSSTVCVRLKLAAERLEMQVEDRGVGLPQNGAQPEVNGLGLVAMRERAEILGGKLEFRRPAEGGTLISLDVPLES